MQDVICRKKYLSEVCVIKLHRSCDLCEFVQYSLEQNLITVLGVINCNYV